MNGLSAIDTFGALRVVLSQDGCSPVAMVSSIGFVLFKIPSLPSRFVRRKPTHEPTDDNSSLNNWLAKLHYGSKRASPSLFPPTDFLFSTSFCSLLFFSHFILLSRTDSPQFAHKLLLQLTI